MRPGRAACVCVGAAMMACTDPRARPVPPVLDMNLGAALETTSPGQILGSVHLFDEDGLFSLKLTALTADSVIEGDSTIVLGGETELNRGVNWAVPAGLANGTQITVTAMVTDFAGFATSDTLLITVQNNP